MTKALYIECTGLFSYLEFSLAVFSLTVLIINEIVLSTMKSDQSSDEICFADEIKSVLYSDEVGFHHEVISSHESGIYPVRKDGFS